ncbi:STS14 protein-like [Aristolochia californica]|uniref:STS14 protein-like n=1 Tax=Aristolochia californica TaxID=171875 RepID=UPI0035DFCA2F
MAFSIPQVVHLVTLAMVSMMNSAHGSHHPHLENYLAAPGRPNITEVLMVHNKARAEVGVAPLRWNTKLVAEASLFSRYLRDKKNCELEDDDSKIPYGINKKSGGPMTTEKAVEDWVKGKRFYNYATNTCLLHHDCRVYTQVVWKDTLEVGCAQTVCDKGTAILTVCFYNPCGNWVGEKPY